jgi:hypothetical protein
MNKNNTVQTGLMAELEMNKINSSEEFATLIFEDLFMILTFRENKSLFSCDCYCDKDKFVIVITEESWEIVNDNIFKHSMKLKDRYMFEYSVKIGFYPFDFVKNLYSKFSDKNSVYIYVLPINRDCID